MAFHGRVWSGATPPGAALGISTATPLYSIRSTAHQPAAAKVRHVLHDENTIDERHVLHHEDSPDERHRFNPRWGTRRR